MREGIYSCIFLKLFFLTILTGCVFSEKSHLFDSELAINIFKDMGLDSKEIMTRNEFQKFFLRVITRDKHIESLGGHSQFYVEISRKMSLQVPEEFEIKNAYSYLDQENILLAIEDTVREQYGEQYVGPIRDQFKQVFEGKSNEGKNEEEEVTESNNNENNSANSSNHTEDL